MKKITFWKSFFLLFALIVGSMNVWADNITFNFESSGSHRASGNNSYTGTNNYSQNNVSIALTYADAVSSGSPINGSYHVVGRVKSSTTNRPKALIGPINITNRKVTSIAYKTKGATTITMTVEYSLDNSTWESLESYTLESTTQTKGKDNLNITGTNLYLRFTGSVSSSTNSNRDFNLDDIVITHEFNSIAITSIAFAEPKTAEVGAGGTTTLSPTILPANYNETVDWESDATGVATVNSSGVVTGVAAGTAHITAKAHNNPSTIYDVCTVTVTAAVPVTGVSMKSSTTLLLGGTETLVPTILPTNATNKNVTWSSADDTKVSVDENGLITALALTNGNPVGITATTDDGDFTATCEVTVNPVPVSGVTLKVTEGTLRINKTIQLEATVAPDNATDKTVIWESDDTDKATVSNTGLVTAKAVGTATITAKSNADNTKTATFALTIVDGAISLNPGGSIEFSDFSGAGNGYDSGNAKSTDFTANDEKPYEWSGSNYMSSNGLQLRASSNNGTITSPVVKAPYGYQLVITGGNVTVLIGNNEQTAVSTKTWELPNNTAFTLRNNTSNALTVTKVVITALKQPVATNLAITDPGTLAKDATGTFAYTADTEEANTPAWTSSDTDIIEITNATTGAYNAKARGKAKVSLTLTPTDDTNYRSVSAEREITVNEVVAITAADIDMYNTDETTIGATSTTGYAGTLTYESDDETVATVDADGNVTAVGNGTATITITAPADATNYFAGTTKDITVTVTTGPSYTVTFDAGSGTCATESLTEDSYKAGVELPDATPITGWTFVGWNADKTATTGTEAGENYKPTADCTLYAIYRKGGIVSKTTYTKETSLANVKGATKVVLLNNNQILKSSGTTISSETKNNTNDITVSDDMIFTLSGDDTNGYTLTNAAGYTLGATTVSSSTDNNKAISMTTDNNKWVIEDHTTSNSADGTFTFTIKGSSAAIDYYNQWQTYYNTNYSTNSYTKVHVFVPKVETVYNNDPQTSVAMTDATDVTTLEGSFVEEITYTRKMGKLSTIYLPYESEIPAGMKAYEFAGEESATKLNFTEVVGNKLAAYTPYVLEQETADTDADKTELGATNITIEADSHGQTAEGNWTFKGTATRLTNAEVLEDAGAGKAYIINDGKWHPVSSTPNDGVYIPAYRAYFIWTGSGNAKVMDMSFDGVTTAINGVEEIVPATTKTRKVVKNGRLVIETVNGKFTIDGARMK